MNYQETSEFIKDIQVVLAKHGLSAMSCQDPALLSAQTKGLEGIHLFFTKGEKKLTLRGGSKAKFASSLIKRARPTNKTTITVTKNRYTHEDDGN